MRRPNDKYPRQLLYKFMFCETYTSLLGQIDQHLFIVTKSGLRFLKRK